MALQGPKAKDVLAMNNAYHGHTNSLIYISPYKFNGKGGLGKKEHVHTLDMPDGIHGKWTYKDKNWIKKYIDQGKQTLDKIFEKNRSLSCFFAEFSEISFSNDDFFNIIFKMTCPSKKFIHFILACILIILS